MSEILHIGNQLMRYAITHNTAKKEPGSSETVAHLPLDAQRFEQLGSPDIVTVYPVGEGDVCLSFHRTRHGVDVPESVAYMRLPFGEGTHGVPELSGYTISTENQRAVDLTDTQRQIALEALKNALNEASGK